MNMVHAWSVNSAELFTPSVCTKYLYRSFVMFPHSIHLICMLFSGPFFLSSQSSWFTYVLEHLSHPISHIYSIDKCVRILKCHSYIPRPFAVQLFQRIYHVHRRRQTVLLNKNVHQVLLSGTPAVNKKNPGKMLEEMFAGQIAQRYI